MESSETTSTVNALGLIPLFSLECRVVLAEVLCSAVLAWLEVAGMCWLERTGGRAGWWRRLD